MKVDLDSKIYWDFEKLNYDYCTDNWIKGHKLVFINGTFDMFHAGHARLLHEASKYGDKLLVFTNTDESIKALKGPERPIISLENRINLLASLHCVDAVFPFPELRVSSYLSKLRPHIWVKGGDYTMDSIEESEKEIANDIGINIVLLPRYQSLSSTELINKIKDSERIKE